MWDKLKLKNVPLKAKICWSSTDPKVVKIRERKGTGIWYEVVGEGKARIVAIIKKKKPSCRITVKIKKEPMETIAPTPDSDTKVDG